MKCRHAKAGKRAAEPLQLSCSTQIMMTVLFDAHPSSFLDRQASYPYTEYATGHRQGCQNHCKYLHSRSTWYQTKSATSKGLSDFMAQDAALKRRHVAFARSCSVQEAFQGAAKKIIRIHCQKSHVSRDSVLRRYFSSNKWGALTRRQEADGRYHHRTANRIIIVNQSQMHHMLVLNH